MLVSIITITKNSENFLQSAIDSVKKQTYNKIEHIIIDGESNDNTINIIKSNIKHISKFISESDKGIYDAMNKGISYSNGDLIGFLNSDDIYKSENIISEIVEKFKNQKDLKMLCGDVKYFTNNNLNQINRNYRVKNFKNWKLKFGFMPAHPGTFTKKEVYDLVGSFNIEYKIAGDFEWYVRCFLKFNVQYLIFNKSIVYMRYGGISSSYSNSLLVTSKEQLKALRSNGIKSNIFLILINRCS